MIPQLIKFPYWIVPISWSIIIFFSSPALDIGFSPDSFGYYLLGDNFFSGHGYSSPAIRDFYVNPELSPPSRSFPPLLPLLIGMVIKITGWGIVAGTIVNLAVLYATLHIWFLFSKRMFGKFLYVSFFCFVYFVFNNEGYIDEVYSGRSVPLVVFFLFLLMHLSAKLEARSPKSMIAIGITLAALPLTRFDALLFSISVLILYSFWLRRDKKGLMALLLGFFLVMAPWMIRNLALFGNPFASDNAVTAFSTYPAIVQLNIFDNGIPLATDNIELWFHQRVEYFVGNVKALISTITGLTGWLILALILASLCLIQRNVADTASPENKNKNENFDPEKNRRLVKVIFLIGWLWVLTNTALISLTPYRDNRYLSASVLMLLVMATLSAVFLVMNRNIVRPLNSDSSNSKLLTGRPRFLVTAIVLLIATPALIHINQVLLSNPIFSVRPVATDKFFTDWGVSIDKNALIASVSAEQMAYSMGLQTIYLPGNFNTVSDKTSAKWIKKWKVDYLILDGESNIQQNLSVILLKTIGNSRLLDVRNLKMDGTRLYVSPTFYLTDGNWEQGISRKFSGFFVPNTSSYLTTFIPESIVRFRNGESRKILSAEPYGNYLHIKVSGNLLRVAEVGIPNDFIVMDTPAELTK